MLENGVVGQRFPCRCLDIGRVRPVPGGGIVVARARSLELVIFGLARATEQCLASTLMSVCRRMPFGVPISRRRHWVFHAVAGG